MVEQNGVVQKKGSRYYIYDPKPGRELLLRRNGSLKGRLEIRGEIDLIKPIDEQVRQRGRSFERGEKLT